MSTQETVIGKLVEIEKMSPNESTDQMMTRLLAANNFKIEDWDDVEEEFQENLYRKFIKHGDIIYRIDTDKKALGSVDIAHATKCTDGNVHFVVSYYNGGCSLDEMLSEALDGMWWKTTT